MVANARSEEDTQVRRLLNAFSAATGIACGVGQYKHLYFVCRRTQRLFQKTKNSEVKKALVPNGLSKKSKETYMESNSNPFMSLIFE